MLDMFQLWLTFSQGLMFTFFPQTTRMLKERACVLCKEPNDTCVCIFKIRYHLLSIYHLYVQGVNRRAGLNKWVSPLCLCFSSVKGASLWSPQCHYSNCPLLISEMLLIYTLAWSSVQSNEEFIVRSFFLTGSQFLTLADWVLAL